MSTPASFDPAQALASADPFASEPAANAEGEFLLDMKVPAPPKPKVRKPRAKKEPSPTDEAAQRLCTLLAARARKVKIEQGARADALGPLKIPPTWPRSARKALVVLRFTEEQMTSLIEWLTTPGEWPYGRATRMGYVVENSSKMMLDPKFLRWAVANNKPFPMPPGGLPAGVAARSESFRDGANRDATTYGRLSPLN